MQTLGWSPFFIQMHRSPLQGWRDTLQKSYIFISFAKPRSLTRVRLRSSRQRQAMAELWCTTAINVSQEGRHARWEEEKNQKTTNQKPGFCKMPFGNKTFTSPITSGLCVIHQLTPCVSTVQAHVVCLFHFHFTAIHHWVTCCSINPFFFSSSCASRGRSAWISSSGRDFSHILILLTNQYVSGLGRLLQPTQVHTGYSPYDWLIRY